ncbi:MAG TPA: DUF6390 family protein [Candidatus Nanoarchaeia archaeon]|nr:DUF6390 family protein [Candidatus Nanoarchaeia archaeon]
MDGIELAARFSYITNHLRFCGPKEASNQFIDYINSKSSSESVKESLMKFEGLYPYLSIIAKKTKKNFYDYDVVESYWIGNELLEQLDKEDIIEIIQKLMQRGLPKSIGNDLIKNLPDGMVPHHNFNVFYVGVGRTSGTVETTLQNMDNCRISYGKVIDIIQDKLIVKTSILKKENDELFLAEDEIKTVVFLKDMLPEVKKGDIVALHWGFACFVLSEEQIGNLKKYTGRILDIINRPRH